MSDSILVAVAWPYANGPLHLGHIAGSYLPADIFARFHRLFGSKVLMVSGSDAHGTPITLKAESEGVQPQEIVERYHSSFLESWRRFGISFDLFTSTMTENHKNTVQDIFRKLLEKKYIYTDKMLVAYSVDFDRYLPDRYVGGICPHCNFDQARGDQCDSCGQTLDPVDLIDPYYTRNNKKHPVEIKEAEHLFLSLSSFQEELQKWVGGKDSWRANVKNFTIGYLNEGLKDRAITRNLEWGIPVPVEGYDDRRIYVWFEAVIGYLSASIEWAKLSGEPNSWRDFWEKPESRSYYFMGKDNIPFHTVIWPSILLGYGGLNLPTDVPANEYLGVEGRKLSTSRNWAVWLNDYLNDFDPDPLRYYLAAAMPESSDSNFSWSEYIRRNNDELVATFGNLVHRVLTLVHNNFDGSTPLGNVDSELAAYADLTMIKVSESLNFSPRFKEALGHAMALAHETNRFLDYRAPWKQVREDKNGASNTLVSALYSIACLKVVLYPFLPFTSQKLHELLGFSGNIEDHGWEIRPPSPGLDLPKPEPLFVKLDDKIANEMVAKLGSYAD